MVIFHSYVSLPEGKSPFSYGFPMVNLPISIANMGWTTTQIPGAENAFGLLGWLRRSIPSIPCFRGLTSFFRNFRVGFHHQISITRNSWVFPWVLWKILGISWVFPRPQLPSLASVSSCGTGAEAVDFRGEKQRDLTEQNFEFNRSEDLERFIFLHCPMIRLFCTYQFWGFPISHGGTPQSSFIL